MTDVIIFHTDEQGNKTACIMSNSNTAFDDLFEFIKELLTVFNTWADDGSRWHGMRLGTFKDDMKRRGFKTHKFTNGLHFMGIELINEKSFF